MQEDILKWLECVAEGWRTPQEVLPEVLKLIDIESYKKGHIDGAIEVVNGTCSICGSYPMTANCNNAGCDT